MSKSNSSRRGMAPLELAMVLPVHVALLVVILYLGMFIHRQLELSNHVRSELWQTRFSGSMNDFAPYDLRELQGGLSLSDTQALKTGLYFDKWGHKLSSAQILFDGTWSMADSGASSSASVVVPSETQWAASPLSPPLEEPLRVPNKTVYRTVKYTTESEVPSADVATGNPKTAGQIGGGSNQQTNKEQKEGTNSLERIIDTGSSPSIGDAIGNRIRTQVPVTEVPNPVDQEKGKKEDKKWDVKVGGFKLIVEDASDEKNRASDPNRNPDTVYVTRNDKGEAKIKIRIEGAKDEKGKDIIKPSDITWKIEGTGEEKDLLHNWGKEKNGKFDEKWSLEKIWTASENAKNGYSFDVIAEKSYWIDKNIERRVRVVICPDTVFIYINGLNTDAAEAEQDGGAITKVLESANMTDFLVLNVHNRSTKNLEEYDIKVQEPKTDALRTDITTQIINPILTDLGGNEEVRRILSDSVVDRRFNAQDKFNQALREKLTDSLNDYLNVKKEQSGMADLIGAIGKEAGVWTKPAEADYAKYKNTVLKMCELLEKKKIKKLVLLAHSEGNFFLDKLVRETSSLAKHCTNGSISFVALAPPNFIAPEVEFAQERLHYVMSDWDMIWLILKKEDTMEMLKKYKKHLVAAALLSGLKKPWESHWWRLTDVEEAVIARALVKYVRNNLATLLPSIAKIAEDAYGTKTYINKLIDAISTEDIGYINGRLHTVIKQGTIDDIRRVLERCLREELGKMAGFPDDMKAFYSNNKWNRDTGGNKSIKNLVMFTPAINTTKKDYITTDLLGILDKSVDIVRYRPSVSVSSSVENTLVMLKQALLDEASNNTQIGDKSGPLLEEFLKIVRKSHTLVDTYMHLAKKEDNKLTDDYRIVFKYDDLNNTWKSDNHTRFYSTQRDFHAGADTFIKALTELGVIEKSASGGGRQSTGTK